ncbi:helix-turn-helix domain-containing protein [Xenorhabdus japonica]|uniref:SOS-response transcriptional repressor LexA (RecA-mediated autopeptidase) n=1 Tax=Xenorhabdus japonica TaxID=53341 RepID=A0A1I4YDD0_9GAMM|nr:helix-turn-helix transcriptional regulator [Xenorhabdus japonica]SFN35589.1 SOS-response transcriptional repressor LexA (RecA-mediated autopeptidase) [Xenorhabdus japonica]
MQESNNKKSTEADALLSNIAQNIDFLMKKNNIDPQTLSRLTGLGIATINSLRRGVGNPTIATISSIADVFGVNLGEITDNKLYKSNENEEIISTIPLIRYGDLDSYITGKIVNTNLYRISTNSHHEHSLFAVEFSNNLLSPYFDSNTIAIVSKTERFCDSDVVLVKIKDAPICFRQIFVGESGIYFSILGIEIEPKTILTHNYTIIGIVIKSIKKLK